MSAKFQRKPSKAKGRCRNRWVFSKSFNRCIQGYSLVPLLLLIGVPFADLDFSTAAEAPRQKLDTKSEDDQSRSATQHIPTTAAKPENVPSDIEKLLGDLDPSSHEAIDNVPVLIAALDNSRTPAQQRERVAMMLGRIGKPASSAVPVLVRFLSRYRPVTNSDADSSARTSEATCYWTMKSLGLFGADAASAVPEVRRILTDTQATPQLRLLAADTLGQIRSPSAVGVLIEQLMNRQQDAGYDATLRRQVVIDGLANAGPLATGAVPALSRATEDPNATVRRKACQALGALGTRAEGGMGALLERLVLDDDEAVKDAAADAMAQLGSVSMSALQDLLTRGGPDLQWRAARSLGTMGTTAKRSIPELKSLLQSPDDRVRMEATDALLKVSLEPRLVVTTLIQELSNDDRQNRRRAATILISIRKLPDTVLTQLDELSSGDSSASRAAAYVLRERTRQQDQ